MKMYEEQKEAKFLQAILLQLPNIPTKVVETDIAPLMPKIIKVNNIFNYSRISGFLISDFALNLDSLKLIIFALAIPKLIKTYLIFLITLCTINVIFQFLAPSEWRRPILFLPVIIPDLFTQPWPFFIGEPFGEPHSISAQSGQEGIDLAARQGQGHQCGRIVQKRQMLERHQKVGHWSD